MVMETPSVGVAAPNELRECTAGDVKNMNMDKQVATRLFRMLAVNEKTVSSIKRDHASYAKLSLLTQQMGLLQQQAQTVVDKCEAKVAKQARIEEADADPIADISEAPPVKGSQQPKMVGKDETRLAVSSEYDEGAKRLLSMLTTNENTTLAVARDTSSCARLSILAEQVGLLQAQAQSCIDEADLNRHLSELGQSTPGTRIVPGVMYYHYVQNGKEVLSRIADDEWCSYDEYLGKYLYDYDLTFRKVEGKGGIDVLSQGALLTMLGDTSKGGACDDASAHASAPASPLPEVYKPISKVHSRW
jgi:hypothetical protein